MPILTDEQIRALNNWARTSPSLRTAFSYTASQGVPGTAPPSDGLGDRLAAESGVSDFYGINVKQTDDKQSYRGINTIAFEATNFYLTQNDPNTDEAIVNFRGSSVDNGETNTASNLGAGEGVFSSKSGVDLQFKSLVAGTGIVLSSDASEITIDSTGGGGGFYGVIFKESEAGGYIEQDDTLVVDSNFFYLQSDGSGKPLLSFIGGSAIDHGDLTGRSDDDHSQYLLIDGTREMTGSLTLDNAADATLSINIDSGAAAVHIAQLVLKDRGTSHWFLRKTATSNDFQIVSQSAIPVQITTSGAISNTLFLDQGKVGVRTSSPTKELHIAGGGLFEDIVEAEAFYLTTGEISQDGNDLYIRSSSGQVVIDDDLKITHNVVASSFYILPAGEISASGDNIEIDAGSDTIIVKSGIVWDEFIATPLNYTVTASPVGAIIKALFSDTSTITVDTNSSVRTLSDTSTLNFNAVGGGFDSIVFAFVFPTYVIDDAANNLPSMQLFNYSPTVRHDATGTTTMVGGITGLLFNPAIRATVSGGVNDIPAMIGIRLEAKWSVASGATVDFGDFTAVNVTAPALILAGDNAGTKRINDYIGFKFGAVTSGLTLDGDAVGFQSALASGATSFMFQNTGGADSDHGDGDLRFNDDAGIELGSSQDFKLSWDGTANKLVYMTPAANAFNIDFAATAEVTYGMESGDSIGQRWLFDRFSIGSTVADPASTSYHLDITPTARNAQTTNWRDVFINSDTNAMSNNSNDLVTADSLRVDKLQLDFGGNTIDDATTVHIGGMVAKNVLITRIQGLWLDEARVRFDGYLNYSGAYRPQITSDQDDYLIPRNTSGRHRILLHTDASRIITGIDAEQIGDDIYITNSGSSDLVFANQSSSSAYLNRIVTADGKALTLTPDDSVRLWHDPRKDRWRVLSTTSIGNIDQNRFYGVVFKESEAGGYVEQDDTLVFDSEWFYLQSDGSSKPIVSLVKSSLPGAAGGEANTASNLGAGSGVFGTKSGVDLRFKSLIGGTAITLSSDSDEITIDGGGGSQSLSKTITVELPTSSEDLDIWFTNVAVTVVAVEGVINGGASTPTVTCSILHNTDRSAAGNQAVNAQAVTSITTGDSLTLGGDTTIPADSFVWLETSAQSGTTPIISLTVRYTED